MSANRITSDPLPVPVALAARAVTYWRTGRLNTLAIARALAMPEADVCRAIHADKEARRR